MLRRSLQWILPRQFLRTKQMLDTHTERVAHVKHPDSCRLDNEGKVRRHQPPVTPAATGLLATSRSKGHFHTDGRRHLRTAHQRHALPVVGYCCAGSTRGRAQCTPRVSTKNSAGVTIARQINRLFLPPDPKNEHWNGPANGRDQVQNSTQAPNGGSCRMLQGN